MTTRSCRPGDGFIAHWENDSLDRLFTKIRDTMPQGGIESVTDAGKLDILAYVLSKNGATPGKEELPLDNAKLETITIARRGGVAGGVSNFTLVQVVGYLARGADGQGWSISKASAPRDQGRSASRLSAGHRDRGALRDAPIRTCERGRCLSGVVARRSEGRGAGAAYRSETENVINLTSLQPLNEMCR